MSLLANSNAISTGGYDINNSLRFRSSASAYLNRTITSSSNNSFTFSAWIKLGSQASDVTIFGVSSSTALQILSTGAIKLWYGATSNTSTRLLRDFSSWYHIVFTRTGGQGGSTSTYNIYVNNELVTNITNVSGGTWLSAVAHYIGTYNTTPSNPFDGYMAEINLVDNQALTPSSFGYTNPVTGVWAPLKYAGTYGTNGFYLPFSDIALTSGSNAGLGKDFSGNGNYWNTNNISVTAGSTYDAMTDSPTLGGSASNYATLNPLQSYAAPTEANLKFTSGAAYTTAASTYYVSSGKWYWEATFVSGSFLLLGISAPASFQTVLSTYTGATATSYAYSSAAAKWNNNAQTSYGATFTTNDVIGVALDMDAGTITFYKNNVSQGTAFTGLSGLFTPTFSPYSCTVAVNFGQRPFAYTPPTGYKALNTYNLSDSTILKGNKYMDATTYTGNGTSQSITNSAGFKPDLVWVKSRSLASPNAAYDSVRGANTVLFPNTTDPDTAAAALTAFNTNGFSVNYNAGYAFTNTNTATYVAWQWQAGQGSTSSNTNGSIASTVSVNTTAGFSVVTYTGTGANATVGHGLGVAPKMIILKPRNVIDDWIVYHASTGATQYLVLNSTVAAASLSTAWQNTAPTSSVFYLGTTGGTNGSGRNFVAYCWAEIAGFSKFGSYTGNGNANGPFVYTGFRPKYVMVKNTSVANNWIIYDTSRSPYNQVQLLLQADVADAEQSASNYCDILSNGFKLRNTNGGSNTSGNTYIYAAFAENPFKNALAR